MLTELQSAWEVGSVKERTVLSAGLHGLEKRRGACAPSLGDGTALLTPCGALRPLSPDLDWELSAELWLICCWVSSF